jgi:hypothetical protein
LLSEQELYDPNTIGSMLKTWLRELPTEIFPQDLQHALAAELQKENPYFNVMGQPAPQKLRDALSELPPFNYYLLFAITCHLSLLLSLTRSVTAWTSTTSQFALDRVFTWSVGSSTILSATGVTAGRVAGPRRNSSMRRSA